MLAPLIERGVPVVGLEPSCLLTLRDEYLVMGLGEQAEQLSKQAFLLEEFLAREIEAGRIKGPIGTLSGELRLHGHCHQKAFGIVPDIQKVLGLVEGLDVKVIEIQLLRHGRRLRLWCRDLCDVDGDGRAVVAAGRARGEASKRRIAADGFSCRHQIADGDRP